MADPLSAVTYRVGQVLRGLRTTIEPDDARAVRSLLTDVELELFLRMLPRDRKHSICVMRRLQQTGGSDELLAAALLHDIAKGRPRVWDRAVFAVLEGLSLRLVDRLVAPDGGHWRRTMWALRHHAQEGATMLRRAGSSERVVTLVEHHTERSRPAEDDAELARLIAADGAC